MTARTEQRALPSLADDEAASGVPEGFAFRQRANVAQGFGHDAQAWAKYKCQSRARIFKGTADDSSAQLRDSLQNKTAGTISRSGCV
jgi:hypothetical protein